MLKTPRTTPPPLRAHVGDVALPCDSAFSLTVTVALIG